MSLILSLESSNIGCSAALHQEGLLVSLEEIIESQSAASQLAVMIDRLFSKTSIQKEELKAVAVSIGPGSYTGLRIGVATAKGIGFGLNIPLISLDSLRILAAGVSSTSTDLMCPMFDARRMEVYCMLLDASHGMIENSHPKIIDEQSFADTLTNKSILFFGEGSKKCKAVIQSTNAKFDDHIALSASNMGILAFEKYKTGQFADISSLEPNYLKEFQVKTKMA